MPKGEVEVLLEYCKGCGLCVVACPTGALQISAGLGPMGVNPAERVAENPCRLCRNCTVMCPDAAIRLFRADDADGEREPKE